MSSRAAQFVKDPWQRVQSSVTETPYWPRLDLLSYPLDRWEAEESASDSEMEAWLEEYALRSGERHTESDLDGRAEEIALRCDQDAARSSRNASVRPREPGSPAEKAWAAVANASVSPREPLRMAPVNRRGMAGGSSKAKRPHGKRAKGSKGSSHSQVTPLRKGTDGRYKAT